MVGSCDNRFPRDTIAFRYYCCYNMNIINFIVIDFATIDIMSIISIFLSLFFVLLLLFISIVVVTATATVITLHFLPLPAIPVIYNLINDKTEKFGSSTFA